MLWWLIWIGLLLACVCWYRWAGQRIGDRPYCRACRYDVSAQYGVVYGAPCPECGVPLVYRQQVVFGQPRSWKIRAWATTALVLVGILPLLNLGSASLPIMPSWYLRYRIQAVSLWPAVDAYAELSRRQRADNYPATDLIDAGFDLIERYPNATTSVWQHSWPAVFVANCTPKQAERLLDLVEMHSVLRLPERIAAGNQTLPFTVGLDWYLSGLEVNYRIDRITRNDLACPTPTMTAHSERSVTYQLASSCESGTNVLRCEVTLMVGPYQGRNVPGSGLPPFQAIATRKLVLEGRIEGGPPPPIVEQRWSKAADAKFVDRMNAHRNNRFGAVSVLSESYSIGPGEIVPHAMHEVYVDFGHGFRLFGSGPLVVFHQTTDEAGDPWIIGGRHRHRGSLDTPCIDVLWVPSARAARQTVGQRPVWPRAILFEGLDLEGNTLGKRSLSADEFRYLIRRDPNMDLVPIADEP